MRVAGAAARPADGFGGSGGDTATMQAVPMDELPHDPYGAPDAHGAPEAVRDEIEVGPGTPEVPAPRRRPAKARKPAKVGRRAKAPAAQTAAGAAGEGGGRTGGRTGLKVAAVAAGALVVVGGGAAGTLMASGDDDKAVVQPSPLADAPKQPTVDAEALAAARQKQAVERASRYARKETARRPVLMPKGTPLPTKKPEESD
ncbi:MAG: hypothetical protein IRY90_10410, partial [Actinomadura rubrobrunea]|nr:hypothetical protein [Actinomadura rubrobrunea]